MKLYLAVDRVPSTTIPVAANVATTELSHNASRCCEFVLSHADRRRPPSRDSAEQCGTLCRVIAPAKCNDASMDEDSPQMIMDRAETICAAGGAAITLESGEGRQVPPPQGGMPVTSLAAPAQGRENQRRALLRVLIKP
jgi:hypothetical protein